MKITVDTNVLISSTFWYGDSEKIMSSVEQKKIELVLSDMIIKEYAAVLNYKEIIDKIKAKRLEFIRSINKIISISTIVSPQVHLNVVTDDTDDNMIIECAKERRVDYIISQDNHLLKLKEFDGIPIVTPKDFLKNL